MTDHGALNWLEMNQRYLSAELERVRLWLEERAGTPRGAASPEVPEAPQSAPAALASICRKFKLSPFERDILLLCAAVELDSRFSALCARLQDDPATHFPTFSLALSVLPDAHWSAFSPAGPLRYWRLIELGAGNIATRCQMKIDERILHYLTGTAQIDERLTGYVKPVPAAEELVPTHALLAGRIARTWSEPAGSLPVLQLCGGEAAGKRNIAAHACRLLGMNLNSLSAHAIPSDPLESESLRRLWQRESVLGSSALLLDCDDADGEPAQSAGLQRWIESAEYPLIVSSRERRPGGLKHIVSFDIAKPTTAEQQQLWRSALGDAAIQLNGRVESLVSTFSLDARTIQGIAAGALQNKTADADELGRALWQACSEHAHPRLGELAQRIRPMAGWDDLVLPEPQLQTLQDVARQIRQRMKVYETWGFAAKSARGLGISALFAGVSGTGKNHGRGSPGQ